MHKCTIVVLLFLVSVGMSAQQSTPTTGEKTRPNAASQSYNLPGGYAGTPDHQLKTVNVKAVVQSIDLEQRLIKVAPEPDGQPFKIATARPEQPLEWGTMGEMDIGFLASPVGMEKIEVSKSLAKKAGTKMLSLENLQVGSVLKAEIYPIRTDGSTKVAAQKITVEKLGK